MSITIGSNIASLRGIRALKESTDGLGAVFERLSSGQRINRASDDAAGLAIAENLAADSRIFAQGVRNLNDGLSLLNIADSALESLTSIIIRLEELATQAANGAYGHQQREAMDTEAQTLSNEFLRIVQTTKFNDQSIFDGSLQEIQLQAGFGANAILSADVGGAKGTGGLTRVGTHGGTLFTEAVVSGDFNGDGNVDVVSGSQNSNNLKISFGYGNGSFSSSATIASGLAPSDIKTGDFNNDGILDLIVSDEGGASVQIYEGLGDGTFNQASSTSVGGAAESVVVGDLNGDGNLDAVTAYNDEYEVLLGDGHGGLTSVETGSFLGTLDQVAVGDFNNDGVLDLVQTMSAKAAKAYVYIGNGDGTFGSGGVVTGATDLSQIRTADVNGDGNIDLIGGGVKALAVSLGDGEGNFSAFSYFTGSDGGVEDISLGDMNGDGFIDAVMSFGTPNEVVTLLNDGSGVFEVADTNTFPRPGLVITLADINNDSVLDAVTGLGGGSALAIYLGDTENGIGGILPFSLATMADARQALPLLARKRELLTQQRGEIGAIQSRIEVATSVLESTAEAFKAAESSIRDTDIATDAARLVRLGILQQASTAILAQANVQPSLALALLS